MEILAAITFMIAWVHCVYFEVSTLLEIRRLKQDLIQSHKPKDRVDLLTRWYRLQVVAAALKRARTF